MEIRAQGRHLREETTGIQLDGLMKKKELLTTAMENPLRTSAQSLEHQYTVTTLMAHILILICFAL